MSNLTWILSVHQEFPDNNRMGLFVPMAPQPVSGPNASSKLLCASSQSRTRMFKLPVMASEMLVSPSPKVIPGDEP